jgi:hypothetical protein
MSARVVCQFSCGAASAVAAKLAIAEYGESTDVQILNAYIVEEHPDNRRFLTDCEKWFGRSITVIRDAKYGASTMQVFTKKRFLAGTHGAPCSRVLKRDLLRAWGKADDMMVLGYTAEEEGRFEDFKDRNPEIAVLAPLIDHQLRKEDCKAMVERAGIELPLMYRLGYDNANCIGCVKGGQAYFRAIRQDFPEQFKALADLEQEIGSGLFRNRKTGERWGLHQLGEGPVRRNDKLPSCSFFCELAEHEYEEPTPPPQADPATNPWWL